MYVLPDVIHPFNCTLYFQMYVKGYKMYIKINLGKQDFTVSKNQKGALIMDAHAFFCMSTSISTTFPKVLLEHI